MPVPRNSQRKQLSPPQMSLERTSEGRIPPQAPEIEVAVLGAILLEKDAFAEVSQLLQPESFYLKSHEIIYGVMLELSLEDQPIDILTVGKRLERNGNLQEVGGMAYLAELTKNVINAASLEYHAMIVAQKSLSRKLIKFSTEVLTRAYDDTDDIEEQMQEAEGALFELSQNHLRKDVLPVSLILKEAIEEINTAANNKEGISGIPTGFEGIDALTAGWQNSDLIVIAARPAMGKTAFVLSMACSMAIDRKIPVALFNLEMSGVQLTKRLISNVCELSSEKLKNGQLEKFEWQLLHERTQMLDQAPLFIDDTPSLSVFELRTKARRLVREHGIRLIIIDYLQLMNASGMSFGNREQEVSTVSRSLKILAKELNIPIIALSQLNRNVETRKDDSGSNSKIPQLSDLRESGAIEQDADMVCFLHRPEVYKIYQDDHGNTKGIGYFIIAKHRNGALGEVRIGYHAEFTKFYPLEHAMRSYNSQINGRTTSKPASKSKTSAPSTSPHPYADPLARAAEDSLGKNNFGGSGFNPSSFDDEEDVSFA